MIASQSGPTSHKRRYVEEDSMVVVVRPAARPLSEQVVCPYARMIFAQGVSTTTFNYHSLWVAVSVVEARIHARRLPAAWALEGEQRVDARPRLLRRLRWGGWGGGVANSAAICRRIALAWRGRRSEALRIEARAVIALSTEPT